MEGLATCAKLQILHTSQVGGRDLFSRKKKCGQCVEGCRGVPYAGGPCLILDPVNSHFRAFSSQTPQTVPAKQRCTHQLFCTSNGDSHQTFQQQPVQISPTYGGEEPIYRQWETQKCEVTAVLFGHFEDPGSETTVYKPGTNCECTTVLLDHSQTDQTSLQTRIP